MSLHEDEPKSVPVHSLFLKPVQYICRYDMKFSLFSILLVSEKTYSNQVEVFEDLSACEQWNVRQFSVEMRNRRALSRKERMDRWILAALVGKF